LSQRIDSAIASALQPFFFCPELSVPLARPRRAWPSEHGGAACACAVGAVSPGSAVVGRSLLRCSRHCDDSPRSRVHSRGGTRHHRPCVHLSAVAAAGRRSRAVQGAGAAERFPPRPLASRRPQIPVKVPLWAAVALRSRNKASIVPPEWLEPAALEEVLRQERESASFQASRESFLALLRAAGACCSLATTPAARAASRQQLRARSRVVAAAPFSLHRDCDGAVQERGRRVRRPAATGAGSI